MLSAIPTLAVGDEDAKACEAIVAAAGYSRRKLLDRMIAAQALVHKATLVTMNAGDFSDLPGLTLLAVVTRSTRPITCRFGRAR
jgi:predicted nucleic acid-binding protein